MPLDIIASLKGKLLFPLQIFTYSVWAHIYLPQLNKKLPSLIQLLPNTFEHTLTPGGVSHVCKALMLPKGNTSTSLHLLFSSYFTVTKPDADTSAHTVHSCLLCIIKHEFCIQESSWQSSSKTTHWGLVWNHQDKDKSHFLKIQL